MVMASGSPNGSASSKLRRSRRLSSTRGLKVRLDANAACSLDQTTRQDPNRKVDQCATATRRSVTETRGRASINWELNERISLSSGSSPGLEVRPDARKGIELSGNRRKPETVDSRRENNGEAGLELMNVSGFQQQKLVARQRKDSWSIDVDVIERRATDENVIKSDSKYEIGVPSEGSTASRKQRIRQLSGRGVKSRNDEEEEVAANGKWGRKKKVEKTNDSISKRLELIHELNQKILANYERFQQRSRFKKDTKDTKDTLSKSSSGSKEQKKDGNEEHAVYAEAKRKGRTKLDGAVQSSCDDSSRQRRLDSSNKFTLSRGQCEKPAASKDQRVDTLSKKRSTKTLSRSRVLRDNENFIMAPRPGFCESNETRDREVATRIEHDGRSKRNGERKADFCSIDDTENDCLGSSRLYPETGYNSNEAREVSFESADGNRGGKSKEPAMPQEKTEEIDLADDGSRNVDIRRGESDRVVDQTALEREILGTLDEAIERFDSRETVDSARLEEAGNKDEKKKKKRDDSNDSMQSDGSLSELTSPKVARLQETFNSSWDSGVGVDVTGGSGWVRIHTGIESSLVYLTLDTTARDVCRDMLLGDDLSLFIQVSRTPRTSSHGANYSFDLRGKDRSG